MVEKLNVDVRVLIVDQSPVGHAGLVQFGIRHGPEGGLEVC